MGETRSHQANVYRSRCLPSTNNVDLRSSLLAIPAHSRRANIALEIESALGLRHEILNEDMKVIIRGGNTLRKFLPESVSEVGVGAALRLGFSIRFPE